MSDYFTDYMLYASDNETPRRLHRWAGLMILSAAMSRKVWVEYGTWRISPNMYVFFVGAPASGKSVALEMAEKVIHDFADIEIAPDAITAQQLQVMMATKCKREFYVGDKKHDICPITILSDELVTLLGVEPTEMVKLLTALYTNRSVYKNHTKNQGKDDIIGPCVTILGCLTPEKLNNLILSKMISGGFNRRITLVCAGVREKAKPWPEPEDYVAKARCVEYAKKVQSLTGPIHLTPQGKAFFVAWYGVRDRQMRESTGIMAEHYSAKNILLLKVATLVAMSERIEMSIDECHLRTALEMLDEIEPDIPLILGGGGRNDLAPIVRSIERFIHDQYRGTKQGVSIKRIKSVFVREVKDNEISEVLQHLYDTDSISSELIGGITFYKPKQITT